MMVYSALLLAGLVIASPWWLLRMVTTQRYREGLGQRLGAVPAALRAVVSGRRVVWVHTVSVGELVASSRLIAELEAELGDGWRVVVSTTTRTGQALARERFGAERVFYYPLDFAWAVRAYLRALRPEMLVLMESELWPRMLYECRRAGVPVAVVNARVSNRSFARGMKVRALWGRVLRMVPLWLVQSEEDGRRLVAMGAKVESVQVSGNLKYDVKAAKESAIATRIHELAAGRRVVVAGSTVADPSGDKSKSEEQAVTSCWWGGPTPLLDTLLVLAPRHPERFIEAERYLLDFEYISASTLRETENIRDVVGEDGRIEAVLLDTIGDLAAVYSVADVAFVGGSLVDRGGHNPLEPAQFGVPVVMGPHVHNFRDVVAAMRAADGIRMVADAVELRATLQELLEDRALAEGIGRRGQQVYLAQQGATARTVMALRAELQQGEDAHDGA